MVENRSTLFGIIALIIGVSGLGLGAFSVVNFQVVEGPPGQDGQDGIDGEDAPGGFIVRILDPDNGESVKGNITIRALIYGSENYTVQILIDGTEIGKSLPLIWNSSSVLDGWKNITVIASDAASGEKSQDTVIIYVENILQSFYLLDLILPISQVVFFSFYDPPFLVNV